jgi:hypothetical protein
VGGVVDEYVRAMNVGAKEHIVVIVGPIGCEESTGESVILVMALAVWTMNERVSEQRG